MLVAVRASRSTCSTLSAMLCLAAVSLFPGSAAAYAAAPPTPLATVASASPEIQPPAGEPQKLVLQAPAPGSGGPAVARGEGKVAAGRPVAFLLRPETAGLFSIGVSSPQSTARISIYLADSTRPEAGTTVADGAIRWSTGVAAGAAVKIVVYTAGAESPFRLEAIAGPGSL